MKIFLLVLQALLPAILQVLKDLLALVWKKKQD
jgi:hypothetical protein